MDQTEEYIKRIIKVLIYIEENIDKDLTMQELAAVSCYSVFHFHRIFQAIVGETIHHYVKRLRMQKAAGKLRYTEQPITEIALDACYETPSAFTKSFKQFMGSSPKQYRYLNAAINEMAQQINSLSMINPDKIENNFSDLKIIFIRRYGTYMKSSSEAWEAMFEYITENYIDRTKIRYFGISHDDPQITTENKLRYDAAIFVQEGVKGKGKVGEQIIKRGKYAIFTQLGPYDEIENTIKRIFLKWLPQSQSSFDETRPVFCEYFNMEYIKTEPNKLITNLYIPLQ